MVVHLHFFLFRTLISCYYLSFGIYILNASYITLIKIHGHQIWYIDRPQRSDRRFLQHSSFFSKCNTFPMQRRNKVLSNNPCSKGFGNFTNLKYMLNHLRLVTNLTTLGCNPSAMQLILYHQIGLENQPPKYLSIKVFKEERGF